MGWGLTIPLIGAPLLAHADLIRALPSFGYTDAWSAETNGTDAFTPLALASAWEPTLRLGTAIVPVFTRGPALIAMSAATMAAAAPGRFVLGLGASSPVIVRNWNGLEFDQPYRRTRDVLRVVRAALNGERVDGEFDTFTIKRFKLEQAPTVSPGARGGDEGAGAMGSAPTVSPGARGGDEGAGAMGSAPSTPPAVLLAALRPQMLRLAGREADGAILNWLASYDVAQCTEAIDNVDADVVARIFVCPTADAEYARTLGRTLISSYLTVPAYAAFHDWLGRGEALRAMHEKWAAGDRAGAAAAIPDEVVDDLVLHGTPEQCRAQVQAYADAGVRTPVIALLPTPEMSTPEAVADIVRRLGRPPVLN